MVYAIFQFRFDVRNPKTGNLPVFTGLTRGGVSVIATLFSVC